MDLDQDKVAVEQNLPEEEKTLSQSQVNDIVKREKAAVAEKVRRELEQQFQGEIEKVKQAPQSVGGMVQPDMAEIEEKIFNRVIEKAREVDEKESQERFAEQIQSQADQYRHKIGVGKERFEDFDEVMRDFDPREFPELALIAGQQEDTSAIMYELAKNPLKLAQLDLLRKRSPNMALKEMKKLAQSIQQNQQAKENHVKSPAPLNRLKSSTVGADDGKMTIRDLKNQPWLRG